MELYYLITLYENNDVGEILKNGIHEGCLYGISAADGLDFTPWKNLTNYNRQHYALFEINNEGIIGEVEIHFHSPLSSLNQIYIKQEWIDPKFIALAGICIPSKPFDDFDEYQFN